MTATSSLKLREKWVALNYNHHQIKNINFIWRMLFLLLLEYLECVWNVWTLSNNRKLINWYFIRLKTFLTLTWSMECCVVMSEWALDFSDDRRGLNFCSFFYLLNLRQTSRERDRETAAGGEKLYEENFYFEFVKSLSNYSEYSELLWSKNRKQLDFL